MRYRKEVAGFDVGAGIGYLQLIPESRTRSVCPSAFLNPNGDTTSCRQLRASVSAKHLDTGLFVNVGMGLTIDGLLDDTNRYRRSDVDDTEIFLSGQAGLERQFVPLGKTTIYGSHYAYSGGASSVLPVGPNDALNPTGAGDWAVWSSNVEIWGGGIAQGIDSAAMILLSDVPACERRLALRQLEGGAATGAIADAPIDDSICL